MMKISIVCIGSIKEKFYTQAICEYTKRLSKFVTINIKELKEEKLRDSTKAEEERVKLVETRKIIEVINKSNDSYNILLDLEGQQITSVGLAEKMKELQNGSLNVYKEINFIIGGSLGISNEIKNNVDYILSFSKMTFPHQLMRVILLEQIYRAYKILNNETYHK